MFTDMMVNACWDAPPKITTVSIKTEYVERFEDEENVTKKLKVENIAGGRRSSQCTFVFRPPVNELF